MISDIGSRVIPSFIEFDYMNLVLSSELSFVHHDAYNSVHYLPIAAGLKFFNPDVAVNQLDGQDTCIDRIQQKYQEISSNLIDHVEYIKYLQST
jgi:translation elongation factor EF-1beta